MPRSTDAGDRTPRDLARLRQKNDNYKKEISKIIKLQAFARGYIVRFAYQSRLTMEKTKRRFFAIQIQAFIRGFLQRQKYRKTTGKRGVQRKIPKHSNTDKTGLGSPKQTRNRTRETRKIAPKPPKVVGVRLDSDSERSEASAARRQRPTSRKIERRSSFRTEDELGESESVASVMSNLSVARKIPDRRRKHEQRENKEEDELGESESVVSVMSNLSLARRIPDRRKKQEQRENRGEDELGESESVVSVMSNLSVARKIPDRRKKQEQQENKFSSRRAERRTSTHTEDDLDESVASMASIMSNLSVARKVPDRRKKQEQRENKLSSRRAERRSSTHTEDDLDESVASMASIMSNLSVARKVPDRRKKQEQRENKLSSRRGERRSSMHAEDDMDESVASMASIMSNLSVAKKVPDRRRKREQKENKFVVKIQALARGYNQRILYKSMLALERTKKNYAAMTIQSRIRGYLQRKNGPQVSRVHVAPRREPVAPAPKRMNHPSKTEVQGKRRRPGASMREPEVKATRNEKRASGTRNPQRTMRKPVRQRSDSDGHNHAVPRQLTIRKPRRHASDSDEESHDLPVKRVTIRKPRRSRDESDGSHDAPIRRVKISGMGNIGRKNGRANATTGISPPRKIMLRAKKGKRTDGVEMDKSEESLEKEADQAGRAERLMSHSNASDRLGESESDVASLMSGLSQARKVPDRRLKRQMPGRSAPKPEVGFSKEKTLEREKSATRIQAIGRGYNARFAFKSMLILEQTKKKFFAVQIQALARGYLARVKGSK